MTSLLLSVSMTTLVKVGLCSLRLFSVIAPETGSSHSGLPISCFLTYVGDNLDSLIEHNAEVAWLSVKGGGVGGHWSHVRGISEKAPGPIPFMKVVDSQMTAYKQGKTRKGSYAAYLDVSQPRH